MLLKLSVVLVTGKLDDDVERECSRQKDLDDEIKWSAYILSKTLIIRAFLFGFQADTRKCIPHFIICKKSELQYIYTVNKKHNILVLVTIQTISLYIGLK